MTAWANIADVQTILPEDETVPASGHVRERLARNLEEATDLVRAYIGHDYDFTDDDPAVEAPDADTDDVPDTVPGPVRRVVARVALRAFLDEPENPGAAAETNAMGPFSHSINWSRESQARDFYLTESDKDRLYDFRQSTPRAVGHVPMFGYSSGYGGRWW